MGVSIGPAAATDLPRIVALWKEAGLTRPWNNPDADFRLALEGPSSEILLAEDKDTLVATVMVGFDGHRGWVYYLAVAPDRRRNGLGRTMMEVAEAWLRARGAPKIQLMVRSGNTDAIGFYERLGLARQDVVTLGRFLS